MQLYNGDYLEVLKNIPDNSIDCIITDPPYLFVKGGQKSKKWNVGTWSNESYTLNNMAEFGEKEIFIFLDGVINKLKKVNMFVFCSRLQIQFYFKWIMEHKKIKYDLLVWNKEKINVKMSKVFANDIEYIIRLYEPGVSLNKIYKGEKLDSEYYRKIRTCKQPKGEHETMKPIKILQDFIELSTKEGDIVLDCFMGSGSTGVACLNSNRNFIGIELNRTYFDLAKERIEKTENELKNNLFYEGK